MNHILAINPDTNPIGVFRHIEDDNEQLDGPVTVSLLRWTRDMQQLTDHPQLGIRLPNGADVSLNKHFLLDRPLLVLDFPTFSDGRAFSQASQLRQKFGFKGRLRAKGKLLLPDQWRELQRCGFDDIELE